MSSLKQTKSENYNMRICKKCKEEGVEVYADKILTCNELSWTDVPMSPPGGNTVEDSYIIYHTYEYYQCLKNHQFKVRVA